MLISLKGKPTRSCVKCLSVNEIMPFRCVITLLSHCTAAEMGFDSKCMLMFVIAGSVAATQSTH